MDNGTTDTAALEVMSQYPVKRIECSGEFNFSRVNNAGSEHTSARYLTFLNNDTEILTPQWLEHLLYYAEQPDVGAAGPLLLYPNRTVQHAGVAAAVVADNKYLSEEDAHLKARQYFVYNDHPEVGTRQHAGIPWKMSRTETSVRSAAPLIGQHTDDVLIGLLGYTSDEVAQLRASGALE